MSMTSIARALQTLRTLPAVAVVTVIRVYQKLVSPLLSPRCRYHPTCSRYAVDAVRNRGVVVGLLLGGWRVMRCNPWSSGGIDPVPPRPPVSIYGILARRSHPAARGD